MSVHVLFFTKMTHVWVNFHEKGTFLGHFHEKLPRNVSFSWKLTQTCVIFVKNNTWTLMSYSWVTHEYSCVIFHGNENFFSHFSWKWELAFSFFTKMRTGFLIFHENENFISHFSQIWELISHFSWKCDLFHAIWASYSPVWFYWFF